MPKHFSRGAAALLLGLVAGVARADGPGDGVLFESTPAKPGRASHRHVRAPDLIGSPPRRIDAGPGYAGSEYGLGKPAFTGLGSRPDWGRSNAD